MRFKKLLMALLAAAMLTAGSVGALAAPKGDGNFCPGRDNNCPGDSGGGGGGGGGGGNHPGNGDVEDECDGMQDGNYLIGLNVVVCVGGDVVDIL